MGQAAGVAFGAALEGGSSPDEAFTAAATAAFLWEAVAWGGGV